VRSADGADGGRYLQDLEKYVKDPDFKHNDFWDRELVVSS
jgi:hypothetical protein